MIVRERHPNKNNSDAESYKSLLPEIADLLNTSVSSIEKYPTDIQKMLCEVYISNYHSDEISIKQALGQIVRLNTETERQIKQIQQNAVDQEQERKKPSAQAVLSRELIIECARKIAEKEHQRSECQIHAAEYEHRRQHKGE